MTMDSPTHEETYITGTFGGAGFGRESNEAMEDWMNSHAQQGYELVSIADSFYTQHRIGNRDTTRWMCRITMKMTSWGGDGE